MEAFSDPMTLEVRNFSSPNLEQLGFASRRIFKLRNKFSADLHLMVKGMRRQLAALATKKDGVLGGEDQFEDDDWVIIKKQKVNIWIPSLAVPIQPASEDPRTQEITKNSRKTKKRQPESQNEICLEKPSADEQKISDALASNEDIHLDERILAPAPYTGKTVDNIRITSEGTNQLVGEPKLQSTSFGLVLDQHIYGAHELLETRVAKPVRRIPLPESTGHQTLLYRSIGYINMGIGVLQNRKLRASNLERNIEKAGGLSTWLVSIGLGQFARMFRGKNVDKYQLLSLTMGKLKDMGVNAVGPRRKLIHAIECLSQPYSSNTF